METFAVVGDIGVDCYVNQNIKKPGGIAFNFAYNLVCLGEKNVSLVGVLGNDSDGQKMFKAIKEADIDGNSVRQIEGQTPIQNIALDKGERSFVGYKAGVLSKWKLTKEDVGFVSKQKVLFVPLSDGMEAVFEKVKTITGPVRIVDFSKDYQFSDLSKKNNMVVRNAPFFDIIFVGGDNEDGRMLETLAQKYPNKIIVLTVGGRGSIAFVGEKKYTHLAEKIGQVVDTTGCGDAFEAAFVSTFIKTRDVLESLEKASAHAAKKVSYMGSTKIELK